MTLTGVPMACPADALGATFNGVPAA